MKSVYLKYTEGCCWRRVIDLKLLEEYFTKNGCVLVDSPENADIVCLETCAFVKRTEDIAIREIDALGPRKAGSKTIVCGCLPGINPERMREHYDGDAINTADLEEFNRFFPEFEHKLRLSCDTNRLFHQEKAKSARVTVAALFRFLIGNLNFSPGYYVNLYKTARRILKARMGLKRRIYYLRVGWGCAEPHCTFCVEWRAVGSRNISKPLEECVREVRKGLAEGYTHFAVIADNPGAWGSESDGSFPTLVRTILDADPRVVISNIDGIHPYWMLQYRREFMDLFSTGRIRSIMSPLQSGHNRILGLMNRRYTREDFRDLMLEIRRCCPDIILITQIITGFPGETFEEFQESVDLVLETKFTNVTVFPFYCNPLTPAAQLDGRIGDDEKFRRVDYALKRFGRAGILSLNLGVEINPRKQKVQALYD